MLFKANDISTFKKYVNVSFTFDTNNNFPGLDEAEQEFLKPILGEDLFDILQAQADAENVEEQYEELLGKARRYVAPLSILLGISTRHIQIGDTGLKKTVSENKENVFGWEYREVKEELRDKCAKALDRLWEYLFEEGDTLDWADPSPIKLLFKNGADFNRSYALHQPHRVYPQLKPTIKKVEELFIWDSLGEEFLNELKEVAVPSDHQKKVIDLLKSAIAHFTIHKIVGTLSIKVTENGLTVLLNDAGDQPYKGERIAPDNLLTMTRDEALRDGNKYMKKVRSYLRDNKGEAVFNTYIQSKYFTERSTEKVDYNATRKGIFK